MKRLIIINSAGTLRMLLMFVLLISFSIGASAQDLITTMLEQIAKLEILLQDTKKGISIVQQGLNTIGDIKKGDFDLHSLFFNSLSTVNPAIKNWGKVADIVAMQIQILTSSTKTLSTLSSTGSFTATDISYLSAVYSNLKNVTLRDVDELTSLISDATFQMSDDERMSRIDILFNSVREKYIFLQAFSNRALLESKLRSQEKNGIQKLGKLF